MKTSGWWLLEMEMVVNRRFMCVSTAGIDGVKPVNDHTRG